MATTNNGRGASLRLRLCAAVAIAALMPVASYAATHKHAAKAEVYKIDPAWPKLAPVGIADPKTEARITEIMSKMTLEEKVGQTVQADINFITPEDLKTYPLGSILAGGNSKPGGSPHATPQQWLQLADDYYRAAASRPTQVHVPLMFGIDAVHGHSNLMGAVIFPHNVGLGAAHDPALIRKIGEVTADEMSLVGVDWTFAPTLAVARDKRWGRSYESYSENPADVAAYSGQMVDGLQGPDGGRLGVKPGHIISSPKHFLGDGGTMNGKDQGDAQLSEADLARIHGAGYVPAIKEGALGVLVSFSSWNGIKMSDNAELLTGVLKGRMHFDGFTVTDWNAQGQVPGCANDDCPAAFNAGIDMFMAPDSWKGMYEHQLAEVKAGKISMARLDDAVRRILRAKIKGGLFDEGTPKERPLAGHFDQIASAEHRAVARQAVRESLVLIKNQGHILPLAGNAHILLAGDGADNIGKQAGGWTLTWQGADNHNSDFPHGQSIYGGIAEAVQKFGGTATVSVDGSYTQKPDVAIVVIGEDPYAEFQGDRANLAYKQGDDSDLELIKKLKAQGIPVVTVFLSGRPLWTNREINASDAFVEAWLPGTEGGGVADVLIGDDKRQVRNDFHGKLTFSWPRTAVQSPLDVGMPGYDPQFAYGYGLTYLDKGDVAPLSEDSGLGSQAVISVDKYFDAGRVKTPWALDLIDPTGKTAGDRDPFHSPNGAVAQKTIDATKQEDGRSLVFTGPGEAAFVGDPVDISRQTLGKMTISITYRLDAPVTGPVYIGMGKDPTSEHRLDVSKLLTAPVGTWATLKVKLDCYVAAGMEPKAIGVPFGLSTEKPLSISYNAVKLASDEGDAVCPAN